MASTEPKTYRVSPEVDAELRRLAKEYGGVDKALRATLPFTSLDVVGPTALDGRGKATIEVVVPTRRESGFERAQRERRERYDRTAALDSVDDSSIDRSDEYVSN